MRNLKIMFVLLTLFGSVISTKANVKPENVILTKVVIAKEYPNVFFHKGKRFHFRSGQWYVKKGRRFVAVRPPVGIKVRHLPRSNKVVYIKGRKLYKYKGLWYKKKARDFVVVHY